MYSIGHTKNLVTRTTIFISHCCTLGQTATCRPESHFQVIIVAAIVRLTRRVFHKWIPSNYNSRPMIDSDIFYWFLNRSINNRDNTIETRSIVTIFDRSRRSRSITLALLSFGEHQRGSNYYYEEMDPLGALHNTRLDFVVQPFLRVSSIRVVEW